MKDITHYFSDTLKTFETSSSESNEVSIKNAKESEIITKSNGKRNKRENKTVSPDSDNSKIRKSELDIEKSKSKISLKDILPNNSLSRTDSDNSSNKSLSEGSLGSLSNTDLNKSQKNVDSACDTVLEEHNNIVNEVATEKLVSNTSLPGDEKKRRKEKLKILADKKGYSERKIKEEKEAEKVEKSLQERKDVLTNFLVNNSDVNEVTHKPPAYSLLNYFSKATPEQIQKEKALRCKMSVKAEVHPPKNAETNFNLTPNSMPNSIVSKESQSKKKLTEIRQTLSKLDEIQFVRSESLSPTPVLQEKKKTSNKSKWKIQFHSSSFIDDESDSEIFSPKKPSSKSQKENMKTNKVINGTVSTDSLNEIDFSDSETHHKAKKEKDKSRKRRKSKSTDDSDYKRNEAVEIESKDINPKFDAVKDDLIIIEEVLTKRSAPEKIAPLFVKKRKLDPTILAARKLFLYSDISENENRKIERKVSPVRNPMLSFPEISHVTQITPEKFLPVDDVKLQLRTPLKHTASLDTKRFKNLVIKNDEIKFQRWMSTFDSKKFNLNIEEVLEEIESRCDDTRTMWKSISQSAKVDSTRESLKGRSSKRKAVTAKKLSSSNNSVKCIDNHDNVWIHKYKPMSTLEIVGNEQAASKLKNWLEKWKKISMKNDNNNSDDDNDDFYPSDCSRDYLMNDYNQVAVLLGPHGSGKTASVYAVAEELGYSVLEINASSRRTGKRISKELEEATKSHRIKKSDIKQTFLQSQQQRKIPQNSLILLEDVDIIFEEDEGFISAAFQLAANTKRPIVMTCSESCSHLYKMAPQQLHIQFQAATGNRALTLLELISLAETGQKLSLNCAQNLLESGDIRKALLQLQYLLVTGETYILPSIINAQQHHSGMSLWRKTYQCLYKPAAKSIKKLNKKKKKIPNCQESRQQDIKVLGKLACDLDSAALIADLVGIDDEISWNSLNSKSIINLSLTEDMRPYSYLDTLSLDIAEWLTYQVIQKKEIKDSEESCDHVLSKLLIKRTVNSGINSVLSQVTSFTTNQRTVSIDYLPSIRAICRAENTRNSLNNKRGNRFFHYLQGIKLPANCNNVLSAACMILQEKSEKS